MFINVDSGFVVGPKGPKGFVRWRQLEQAEPPAQERAEPVVEEAAQA